MDIAWFHLLVDQMSSFFDIAFYLLEISILVQNVLFEIMPLLNITQHQARYLF